MKDTIYRQAAIDAICKACSISDDYVECIERRPGSTFCDEIVALRKVPSAEPEIIPISYRDCVNAMLRMWIDNVVTDGEYDRIMNKLNAHWGMKNG